MSLRNSRKGQILPPISVGIAADGDKNVVAPDLNVEEMSLFENPKNTQPIFEEHYLISTSKAQPDSANNKEDTEERNNTQEVSERNTALKTDGTPIPDLGSNTELVDREQLLPDPGSTAKGLHLFVFVHGMGGMFCSKGYIVTFPPRKFE
jgi:hypothetical protein